MFHDGEVKVLPRLRDAMTGLPSLFTLEVEGLDQGEGGEYPPDASDLQVQKHARGDMVEMHDELKIQGQQGRISPSRSNLNAFFKW